MCSGVLGNSENTIWCWFNWLFGGLDVYFENAGFPRRTTFKGTFFEKFDFHCFLADQKNFEAGCVQIWTPRIKLHVRDRHAPNPGTDRESRLGVPGFDYSRDSVIPGTKIQHSANHSLWPMLDMLQNQKRPSPGMTESGNKPGIPGSVFPGSDACLT